MSAAAWTAYWRDGAERGCLPGAPPAVQRALGEEWARLARGLPRRARVLDLASGSGAVMLAMRAVRRDLALTGVDLAEVPAPPPGCRLLGGVDLAAMPLPDASFDAVTSQFGIEYASPEAVGEAVRVLAPGGQLHWVLHAADSTAILHNRARLAAMRAMDEAGLFQLARQALAGLSDPARTARVAAAQQAHRAQSIAAELPAALAQALSGPAPRHGVATIEEKARLEMARLDAMAAAALDESAAAALTERVTQLGVVATHAPLAVPGGGRMAWVIAGRRG